MSSNANALPPNQNYGNRARAPSPHTIHNSDKCAVADPPRWARNCAHITATLPLPSGLWRLALVAGYPAGYTDEGLVALDLSGSGRMYLIVLTILIEAAALMTLGLVSRWGVQLPEWMPRWGGRRMRPRLVVVVAAVGAAVLSVLWTPFIAWWALPHPELTDLGSALIGLVYLPLVAWAPLLAAVTFDYYRRCIRVQSDASAAGVYDS